MLPCPPVILAMMSLPQMTSQVTPAINNRTMARRMLVMILRFLDTGFFAFFGFFSFALCLASMVSSGVSLAFNSPVFSSKLKTWVGVRKSSVVLMVLGESDGV